MDFSSIIGQKCFVKSPHGLHYGKVIQDEYDYVIIENAKLFIPYAYEELCPELCAIQLVELRVIVATVPYLQINNVKEIAVVTNQELIAQYDGRSQYIPQL